MAGMLCQLKLIVASRFGFIRVPNSSHSSLLNLLRHCCNVCFIRLHTLIIPEHKLHNISKSRCIITGWEGVKWDPTPYSRMIRFDHFLTAVTRFDHCVARLRGSAALLLLHLAYGPWKLVGIAPAAAPRACSR